MTVSIVADFSEISKGLVNHLAARPALAGFIPIATAACLLTGKKEAALFGLLILFILLVMGSARLRKIFLFWSLPAIWILLVSPSPHWINTGEGNLEGVLQNRKEKRNSFSGTVLSSKGEKILLRWSGQGPFPGDRVLAHGKFNDLESPGVPGVFDYRAWLMSQGIRGSMTQDRKSAPLVFSPQSLSWRRVVYDLQQNLERHLYENFPGLSSGFLQALILGRRDLLDPELRSNFRLSGVMHLLAISGMHVGLFAFCILLFFEFLRFPKKMVILLTALVLLAYVPLCGAPASVMRAVFMFWIWALGRVCGRSSSATNSIGLAACLLLILQPESIDDPGLQLSLGATFSLVHLGGLSREIISNFRVSAFSKNWILFPIFTTCWATFGTLPLMLELFHSLSPASLPANLLLVPTAFAVLLSGILALIFSFFEPLAQVFAHAAGGFSELSRALAAWTAELPGSQQAMPASHAIWWILHVSILLLAPSAFAGKRAAFRLLLGLTLLSATAFSARAFYRYTFPTATARILDVGQGDAIHLEFPSGKHLLVDAGLRNPYRDAGKNILLPYLRSRGISRLDGLLITHADIDHYGGAESLLRASAVDKLFISVFDTSCTKTGWKKLLRTAKKMHVPIVPLHSSLSFAGTGNTRLEILWPPPKKMNLSSNDRSIVLRMQSKNASLLLTGDLGKKGEIALIQKSIDEGFSLRANLLKLGHHGSKSSSTPDFLAAVSPQHGLISAGRKNRYGHPHPETLGRMKGAGIYNWQTFLHGSLFIDLRGGNPQPTPTFDSDRSQSEGIPLSTF